MSVYCISDIHGCFDEFSGLLEAVGFSKEDRLYILGDIVDRGPKIAECLEWLANSGDNVKFLWGNHEEMMSWALMGDWSHRSVDEVMLGSWIMNGGFPTMESLDALDASTLKRLQQKILYADKVAHVTVNGTEYVMSHAGIRAAEPESEPAEWYIQSEEDLLWISAGWWGAPETPPFQTVFGHTPTMRIAMSSGIPNCPREQLSAGIDSRMMHWNGRNAIDCGCVFGGRLGMWRLDDGEEFYIDCLSDDPEGYPYSIG